MGKVIFVAVCAAALLPAQKPYRTSPAGYADTPVLPAQKWPVHDIARPKPSVVTPAAQIGQPPSDALVLFQIEWASPTEITGDSQWRGNSFILIMNRYEIQVLDSYNNPAYADCQAGAIYGQWPPLVNAARTPSQWAGL